MAVVDDIDVRGASSRLEVAETIGRLLDRPVTVGSDAEIVRIDDDVLVIMYTNADDPDEYIAEVRHWASDTLRYELAKRIYEALVDATDWALRWWSDEHMHGDEPVATRDWPAGAQR